MKVLVEEYYSKPHRTQCAHVKIYQRTLYESLVDWCEYRFYKDEWHSFGHSLRSGEDRWPRTLSKDEMMLVKLGQDPRIKESKKTLTDDDDMLL